MGSKQSLLISFAGSNDPFGRGEKTTTGGQPYGPLISAVKKGDFDHVIILSTKQLIKNAENTKAELEKLFSQKTIEIYNTDIEDPTKHEEIIRKLNKFIKDNEEVLFKKDFDIFISITSGTPAMHACWLLFSASKTIPSKVIHIKEAYYTNSREPEIIQIDFTKPDFPIISPRITKEWKIDINTPPTSFAEYDLIGQSEDFIKACQQAWKYAGKNVDILLLGETGTGKGLFAEMIHKVSNREGEMVTFNCAGTPENIFESALFGHRKGAFTHAIYNYEGACGKAKNGTLYFDEIGDAPPPIQIKLLRFLENKKYTKVGDNKEIDANIRFVFATNRDLNQLVQEGKIREDFYYRIQRFKVEIPPLRERISDIPILTRYFIDTHPLSKKLSPLKEDITLKFDITPEAMKELTKYNWPGNVRQLSNTIEKAVVDSIEKRIITPDVITFEDPKITAKKYLHTLPYPYEGFRLDDLKNEIHDYYIQQALKIKNNNQSEAAKLLGITPQAINQYLKRKSN